MALSNAEKQARWRARHAEQLQQASRLAALLLRRSRSDGAVIKAKVGWHDVTFDAYFARLAGALCAMLGSDRAIKQLRWALAKCLDERKHARQALASPAQQRAWEASHERAVERRNN